MSDISLSERAEDCIADSVHEDIGIRMTFETLGMWNFNSTEDELSAFNQGVDVITDANMDHGQTIGMATAAAKSLVLFTATAVAARRDLAAG